MNGIFRQKYSAFLVNCTFRITSSCLPVYTGLWKESLNSFINNINKNEQSPLTHLHWLTTNKTTTYVIRDPGPGFTFPCCDVGCNCAIPLICLCFVGDALFLYKVVYAYCYRTWFFVRFCSFPVQLRFIVGFLLLSRYISVNFCGSFCVLVPFNWPCSCMSFFDLRLCTSFLSSNVVFFYYLYIGL